MLGECGGRKSSGKGNGVGDYKMKNYQNLHIAINVLTIYYVISWGEFTTYKHWALDDSERKRRGKNEKKRDGRGNRVEENEKELYDRRLLLRVGDKEQAGTTTIGRLSSF